MEWFDYINREAARNAADEKRELRQSREERFLPMENVVICEECLAEFHRYTRAYGFESCEDHTKARTGNLAGTPRPSTELRGKP